MLHGMDSHAEVGVSKEIYDRFVPREEIRHYPEVHVASTCCKVENGIVKVLLGKRVPTRKLYPNKWDGCGGQLAADESFVAGVKRHYKSEWGIDVEVEKDTHKLYGIQVPDTPYINGLNFLCTFIKGEPRSENHSEFKWFTKEEIIASDDSEFIPGHKDEVLELMRNL